ncbi:hypothetical protein AP058_00792 [Flavobacterium sp. TAB 87]|nr:hypothetical protein AP058_00792 [Flavobacterium sp. TAB 87]
MRNYIELPFYEEYFNLLNSDVGALKNSADS